MIYRSLKKIKNSMGESKVNLARSAMAGIIFISLFFLILPFPVFAQGYTTAVGALELYPAIEKLPVKGGGSIAAAVRTDGRAYMGLRDFAAGSTRYTAFS